MATKSPWPPVDGGRVLLWNSLRALHHAGVEVTLLAPAGGESAEVEATAAALSAHCEPCLIPVPGRGRLPTVLGALRVPLTMSRHTRPEVLREAGRLLASRRFDVVHAEQLQALPQTEGAAALGIPVVLRAQNVESDLWSAWAERANGALRPLLRLEARRLARWEGGAVRAAAATWALSREDAGRLGELARHGRGAAREIEIVRPPFPLLEEGGAELPGSPAVVLMGSQGWRPNEDAVRWFLQQVWPVVLGREPDARLHLFGGAPELEPGIRSVDRHPAPGDSVAAFARGSIQVVPLRVGSGVRIKILEAWARGVPVVGTPQAFAGLEIADGEQGLVADDAAGFAAALGALHRDGALRERMVESGKRLLLERHSLERIGLQMAESYERVAARARCQKSPTKEISVSSR